VVDKKEKEKEEERLWIRRRGSKEKMKGCG